jgi:hypothetical protein
MLYSLIELLLKLVIDYFHILKHTIYHSWRNHSCLLLYGLNKYWQEKTITTVAQRWHVRFYLSRGHEIQCRGNELQSRGHEIAKSWPRDTMSWPRVTMSWPRVTKFRPRDSLVMATNYYVVAMRYYVVATSY